MMGPRSARDGGDGASQTDKSLCPPRLPRSRPVGVPGLWPGPPPFGGVVRGENFTMRGLLRRVGRLRERRGIAAVMFGVLLPVFLGLTALAVDVSVIALARNQLNTAADAGALAGAMKLADERRVRGAINLSTEITAANAQAAALAQGNSVLNVAPVVVQDPNNEGSGDIRVGYLDP